MKAFYTIFLITLSFSLSVQNLDFGSVFRFDSDSDVEINLFDLIPFRPAPFHERLQAIPPTVSYLKIFDNHLHISPNQLPHELQNTLMPALHHGTAAVASGKISEIAETILLSTGLGHQTVRHDQWEFNIMDGTGRLLVFRVKAQIHDYDVHITGGITEVVQNVPTAYEKQVKCSNTGRRRYIGIAGPRERECRDLYVERGLNHDEIRMVYEALMNRIPTALHMLQ